MNGQELRREIERIDRMLTWKWQLKMCSMSFITAFVLGRVMTWLW